MFADPAVEATFVPADPPRAGWMALWRFDGAIGSADDDLELVLPAGRSVRRRTVAVRRVALDDIIDPLMELAATAEVRPSVRAWATATRLAVDLVGRGRILPATTAGGGDAWSLGPLDPDDVERRRRLGAALPPAAHAVPLPGTRPIRVWSADVLVDAFSDAIADVLPRTAAAPLAAGHPAFATRAVTQVDVAAPWFATVTAADDEATVALRLEPPGDDQAAFAGVLLVQSRRDASLVVQAEDLWSMPSAVLAQFGDVDTTLLVALRRGSRAWSPLGRLLEDTRPARLELTDSEVDELLGDAADALAAAGIQVLWPSELLASVSLRPVVSTPTPAAVAGAGLTMESLLTWQASLDGFPLTTAELAALADAKRPLVRLRGRWVRADPERLGRLRRRRTLGGGAALAAALGGELRVDGELIEADVEGPIADLARRLRSFEGAGSDGDRIGTEPDGLEATLRPYQLRGLSWLVEMAELGLGGILADDMGLGKTVQMLAAILARNHARRRNGESAQPTLVVCPATLLGNWEREANRFAPELPVRRFHGAGRTLEDLAADELVLATYGVVRRDAAMLAPVGWGLVIADEAQAIKNPLAGTARALRTVPAAARFALTGTPVENRLTELWAILDWTTPGLLGPLETFRREVAIPVERNRDPHATQSLAHLVRPFLLRRRKSDPTIVPELPPKTETDRVVPLTVEQATLYKAVVDQTMDEIRNAEGINRRGLVLKLLNALKQICNHPAQYLDQPGPLAGRSGKLTAAVELLEVIGSEDAAALVFTQYVRMGRLLEEHLSAKGMRTLFLHGSLTVRRRQEMVDRFQAGHADAFVISLKAGGTGLNLTRASHVIHYDRWWNPAVEDQASDRAWRIGQDQPVQVHRMVCEGTVEDRISALLATKRELAEAVVGGGEAWITEMGDDDLADLVALSAETRTSTEIGS